MVPLFENQKTSFQFVMSKEATFDASDPGTGKTRVVIEVFKVRRVAGAGCLMVIAPRSLLRSAWADDFLKFAPALTVSVAYASNREESFAANADVYVTNTDATKWLAKQPAKFWEKFKDGMLVVDESSYFKHHTSARTKALLKIKSYFRYRHCMNGTPNDNTITDVWSQYFFLDNGRRLGTSFYAFRNSVCESKQVGPAANMVKWSDKPGIEQIVGKLVEGNVSGWLSEQSHVPW